MICQIMKTNSVSVVCRRQGSQNIQEATVEICQPNVCDDNLKAYSHDIGYEKLVRNADIVLSDFGISTYLPLFRVSKSNLLQ